MRNCGEAPHSPKWLYQLIPPKATWAHSRYFNIHLFFMMHTYRNLIQTDRPLKALEDALNRLEDKVTW